MLPDIQRLGTGRHWSEIVIHAGTAYWAEVADDPQQTFAGQTSQILSQIDGALERIGSDRTRLLQVIVYLTDLADMPTFNKLWDEWLLPGHAPVRACVQAGLAPGYKLEMVVTAASLPGSKV